MAPVALKLVVDRYFCEPCTLRQGTLVQELIQIIPRSVVMNGELVGDPWWGCPVCLKAKFPVKKRVKRDKPETDDRRTDRPRSRRAKQAAAT